MVKLFFLHTCTLNIVQKRAPIGSGLLPGDNYPNWLTFNSNDSFVTFEVPPQVDGRNLKKIMCLVYSYSPDNTTTEGLKVLLVINYTKNTIHVYKRNALLVSPDEEEWRRVISNIEPGNEIKVVVVSTNELTVKKTTIYLVYDEPIDVKMKHEPDENVIGSSGNFNVSNRSLNFYTSYVYLLLLHCYVGCKKFELNRNVKLCISWITLLLRKMEKERTRDLLLSLSRTTVHMKYL